MTAKPTTRDGYSSDQLDVVTQTCLYVFTKIGDLLDDVVIVGGLVPYLLVDQDDPPMLLGPHSGTTDLDLGLSLATFDEERYQDLTRIHRRDASVLVRPGIRGVECRARL